MLDPLLSQRSFQRDRVLLSCAGLMGLPRRGAHAKATMSVEQARGTRGELPATDNLVEQNIVVVNLNGNKVSFDNGVGGDRSNGPTPGRSVVTLAQAGINPVGRDAVVMTRAHIDACGGMVARTACRGF